MEAVVPVVGVLASACSPSCGGAPWSSPAARVTSPSPRYVGGLVFLQVLARGRPPRSGAAAMLPSSSPPSCGHAEAESDDFPTATKPTAGYKATPAPGGRGGSGAVARPRSASEWVKWLNKHLSKLWPFVSQAATAVVKESVEPLLDDYRPPGIKSLKFNKFSLGNVSPKIEGIRIQNLQPGQIIMDVDFRWGGDPSIILAVDARVASLPIQLKDLQVFTVVRVVFQLSEEIPCISAVVVALLAEASIY